MQKRIISLVLTLCMLLTLLPAEALAEELADLAGTAPAETAESLDDPVYQTGSDTDIIPDVGMAPAAYADSGTVTYTLENGGTITIKYLRDCRQRHPGGRWDCRYPG